MSNLSELLNIRNKSENHGWIRNILLESILYLLAFSIDHSDSLNTDHKTFNFASSSDS